MSQGKAFQPEESQPLLGLTYSPQHDLLHDPMQEDIVLNKWRLQTILDSVEREKERPKLEDSVVWLGALFAFLLAILPGDFEAFLGLSGDVWTAIAVIGSGYSALRVMQIWWRVFRHRKDPQKTTAQRVQEIVDEIRASREAFLNQSTDDLVRLPSEVRSSFFVEPALPEEPDSNGQ